MTALAYPFFRDTAEVVGRLLALQDDFTTAQVQGRMLTTWGDRATSKEAAQKLITLWSIGKSFAPRRPKATSSWSQDDRASPTCNSGCLEALLGASAADEIEAQQLLASAGDRSRSPHRSGSPIFEGTRASTSIVKGSTWIWSRYGR